MNLDDFLIGVCGGLDDAAVFAQAGVDFLEVNVQNFLMPGEEDEAGFVANRAAASALPLPLRNANCFLPASLPCVGPSVDEAALLAYARRAFERAQSVGIDGIVFGSGAARAVPDGFPMERAREQFSRLLSGLAPLAELSGVVLLVEPLNAQECNFINTLEEGAEFVEACGHPNVMLLADTYHMGFSGEGPEAIRRHGKILRHFHVAEDSSRRYPGADGQSFRPWFAALREVRYTGRVSIECRWESVAAEAGVAITNLRRDLTRASN